MLSNTPQSGIVLISVPWDCQAFNDWIMIGSLIGERSNQREQLIRSSETLLALLFEQVLQLNWKKMKHEDSFTVMTLEKEKENEKLKESKKKMRRAFD